MVERVEIIIQRAERADYKELVRFFDENNVVEATRHFHPFLLNEETAHHIACTNYLDRYYIALFRERLVGLCMLRGWDEGYSIPSLGILVDYRFQNRGLGAGITEFAIAEARALGCHEIRLSVYASNEVALRLYTSLGFIESERKSVVVMGEPDEKITMFKDLRQSHD